MSCYFRWMKDKLAKAGIDVKKENREEIDRAIHSVTGVDYKNCSAVWKKGKEMIAENEENFVVKLEKALNE